MKNNLGEYVDYYTTKSGPNNPLHIGYMSLIHIMKAINRGQTGLKKFVDYI